MEVNILNLFPTPVVVFNYKQSLKNELKTMEKILGEGTNRELVQNEVWDKKTKTYKTEYKRYEEIQNPEHATRTSRCSNNTFVLENEGLSSIKTFITEALNEYMKNVFGASNEVIITQSWLNVFSRGDHHEPHGHPNSIVSGVFYPYIEKGMSGISLYVKENSLQQGMNFAFNDVRATEYNSTNYTYIPKSGDLILFPSTLHHGVSENNSPRARLSLAFNSWMQGILGSMEELSYAPPQGNITWN